MTSNQYIVFYLTIIGLFVINHLCYSIWIKKVRKKMRSFFKYQPDINEDGVDQNISLVRNVNYKNWLWYRSEINHKIKTR